MALSSFLLLISLLVKKSPTNEKLFSYKFQISIGKFPVLSPFYPQSHLGKKLRMFSNGNLHQPLDIFDLLWHSQAIELLIVKTSNEFLYPLNNLWQNFAIDTMLYRVDEVIGNQCSVMTDVNVKIK